MSLKPPWKQKNPVMEKACPAYYKNTAPDDIVEFVDGLKATSRGKKLSKEFVHNGANIVGGGKKRKASIVLLRLGEKVRGVMRVTSYPGKIIIAVWRSDWSSLKLERKGETLADLGKGYPLRAERLKVKKK